MFNIKDEYKLELQTPETIVAQKNWQKKQVVVQCNLVDNQYQQNSQVLYTFTLINLMLICVEPNNLVFLKTYNTEFDQIIITFTDYLQNIYHSQ